MKEINQKSIYSKLSKPLPKQAFHTFSKEETGFEYDITSHNYQYVVNRLNEVLGLNNWSITEDYNQVEPGYNVVKKISLHIRFGDIEAVRWAFGGGKSRDLADAHKAAVTNGLKKAAALFGIGKETYEISLDEEFVESLKPENKVTKASVTEFSELSKKILNTSSVDNLEKLRQRVSESKMKLEDKKKLTDVYNKKLAKLKKV